MTDRQVLRRICIDGHSSSSFAERAKSIGLPAGIKARRVTRNRGLNGTVVADHSPRRRAVIRRFLGKRENEQIHPCPCGDADWKVALGLLLAADPSSAARRAKPTLGWCYLTDHYSEAAGHILEALRGTYARGSLGAAPSGSGWAPGLSNISTSPPWRSCWRICRLHPSRYFPGSKPSKPSKPNSNAFEPFTALVHAAGGSPDLPTQLEGPERKDFFRLSVWRAFLGEESALCASPTPRCMEAYPGWPSGPKYPFFRG